LTTLTLAALPATKLFASNVCKINLDTGRPRVRVRRNEAAAGSARSCPRTLQERAFRVFLYTSRCRERCHVVCANLPSYDVQHTFSANIFTAHRCPSPNHLQHSAAFTSAHDKTIRPHTSRSFLPTRKLGDCAGGVLQSPPPRQHIHTHFTGCCIVAYRLALSLERVRCPVHISGEVGRGGECADEMLVGPRCPVGD
jgi:hypothetical protein